MSIWAIGDIQGCGDEFERLLDKIWAADAAAQVWLCGDLVNRGPDSLRVLKTVQSLGSRVQTVLGNHDLYALACAAGFQSPKAGDTMDALLAAPAEWVDWLRAQPLMLESGGFGSAGFESGSFFLSHAGLYPGFDLPLARSLCAQVSAVLQAPDWAAQLQALWAGKQRLWEAQGTLHAQLRFTINAFMRMRLIAPDGGLDFELKESASAAPAGYTPWFDVPNTSVQGTTLVFGHWSALGLINREHLIALDTGCVWGRSLTAVELVQPAAARRVLQIPAIKRGV